MKVLREYRNPSYDGFESLFVFEDGSMLFCSEKRAVHFRMEGSTVRVIMNSYKTGLLESPKVEAAVMDPHVPDALSMDEYPEIWALYHHLDNLF